MLKQRVITALALLAVLLPALFYPTAQPFLALTLLFIALAGWEWARLNGYAKLPSVLSGLACCSLCAGFWCLGLPGQKLTGLWQIVGAAWVLLGAWLLHAGVTAWPRRAKLLRLLGGLAALCLTWLALAQARLIGVNFLLSVLALVWMADIAAYFFGRALGGRWMARKLAPTISPGKSWEGVIGGMLGVLAMAFFWRYADRALLAVVPSWFTQVGNRGAFFLALAVLFLTAMSVVGDLLESLVKRSAGVKDSSGLLPGHGGVLDRIDAVLPTLPLAMMLYCA